MIYGASLSSQCGYRVVDACACWRASGSWWLKLCQPGVPVPCELHWYLSVYIVSAAGFVELVVTSVQRVVYFAITLAYSSGDIGL